MQNYDIWDKARSQMNPRGVPVAVEDDPQWQALAAGKQPPQQPLPPWVDQARTRMGQTQGGQYEVGDKDVDNFNRKRATGGPDEDDPFPDAYNDPQRFEDMMRGAYQAGLNGDDQAMGEILNGPYRDTPLGKLLSRAYQDGRRQRGGRAARR